MVVVGAVSAVHCQADIIREVFKTRTWENLGKLAGKGVVGGMKEKFTKFPSFRIGGARILTKCPSCYSGKLGKL